MTKVIVQQFNHTVKHVHCVQHKVQIKKTAFCKLRQTKITLFITFRKFISRQKRFGSKRRIAHKTALTTMTKEFYLC